MDRYFKFSIFFCQILDNTYFSQYKNEFINNLGWKYNNNIGSSVINKIEFLKRCKFSFSMENTEGNGYISEKIVDSFLAGNIPI